MIETVLLALVLNSPLKQEPNWLRELASCVRQHESRHDYQAENPLSTASGAYQFLDSTWRGNAKWVRGAKGFKSASDAPPHIQDAVFIHSIRNGGHKNWKGTGCQGTD